MKAAVIGASGYIGTAVAERLTGARHEVVAVSRRGNVANYTTVPGDLTRPETLRSALAATGPDVVVHAGNPTGDVEVDLASTAALLDQGAPVIYISGIWWLGAVGESPFTEDPPDGDTPRAQLERAVLAAADRVRTVVVRPGVVYGRGGGIPAEMVGWAGKYGVGRYVGDPGTRWPTVQVDDLADLVLLAIEHARSGAVLHGVGEEAVEVSAIAAAADVAAGGIGRAEAWPVASAAQELGEQYARWLALDQAFSSTRTRAELDWRPSRPTIVEDLTTGSYNKR
ncbi:NAD-dependent epimerase/dehydratase family protein [Kribbella pittospori]|uniref:NAD-dependent epimerase/dehydratase family protein n=1 Tax=Kribbella pittospori TaxID=722689 RepID=A0A4R0JPP8_9ACTN|nr:NAD-dependent epimerase/dehydratase family protein [Kribbella pittospori]